MAARRCGRVAAQQRDGAAVVARSERCKLPSGTVQRFAQLAYRRRAAFQALAFFAFRAGGRSGYQFECGRCFIVYHAYPVVSGAPFFLYKFNEKAQPRLAALRSAFARGFTARGERRFSFFEFLF